MKTLSKSLFAGGTIIAALLIIKVVAAESAPMAEVADNLRLKVSKERILGSTGSNGVVKYAYRSDTRVDNSPSVKVINEAHKAGVNVSYELLEARTSRSKTFSTDKVGTYVTEIIAGPPQYYKDQSGIWWQAEYATTTEAAFEQQIAHRTLGDRVIAILLPTTHADSSTFYPDPNPETNTVDGYSANQPAAGTAWTNVRNDTDGTGANDTDQNLDLPYINEAAGTTDDYDITRGFFLFDTSAIPDANTIESATLSFYFTSKANGDNDSQAYVSVTNTNPASNTSLAASDFDQVRGIDDAFPLGSGVQIQKQSNDVRIEDITTSQYTDFTLNASGLSHIDLAGISKFGLAEGHDIEDSAIDANVTNRLNPNLAEFTGTSQDPKLVIVHSADLKISAYKSAGESRTNNANVVRDTQLVLSLATSTVYSIEGTIFTAASSTAPDIKIAFSIPSGSMHIGYTAIGGGVAVDAEVLEVSGASSTAIALPNTTTRAINIRGTITTGTTQGTTEFRWGQNSSNANAVTVLEGSFITAEVLE